MGWFSGYAEDLMPLPRRLKAKHYIDLMGGAEKVLKASKAALIRGETSLKVGIFLQKSEPRFLSNKRKFKSPEILFAFKESGQSLAFDCQLALELSTMVLLLGGLNGHQLADAEATRVAALKALASAETSANGRNYYLTQVTFGA